MAIMAFKFMRLLTLILLVVSFASADDEGAVMAKFASSISPTPASWTGTNFCNWDNIRCFNGHVTEIHLDRKKLAGTLPSNLNSLTQLKTLFLQGNSFSGEFPSLANLINLQTVYLDNNNFSSIPDGAFSGLNSLRDLSLTSNSKLSPWKFPSELAQSGGLVTLYAGSCSLAGSIPDIFGSFPALKDLRLSFNSLSGSLPSSFAGSEIQNLWLNGNKQGGSGGLSGSIDVIGAMNQLSQVWLHGNSFTGSIPDLTNCTNIIDLQLRENQLTGIVPPSLPKLPNLLNVSLQNNHLQGPYPAFKSDVTIEDATMNSFCTNQPGVACDAQVTTLITAAGAFGYPMTLAESWKGNSACNWPFVSCNSGNVIVINLQKQQLNGSISPAFADLKYLKNLYLNDNNLTGSIPDNLATLTSLLFLNVSNNNISGQVPKFRAGVTVDSKANPFIGRDINPGGGGSSGSNSTDSGGKSKKSSISPGLVAGLVIGVVILVGIVLFILYKCYIRRRDRKFGKVQNPEFGAQMVKTDCMGGVNGYAGLSSEVQSQASVDHNEMPVYEGGNVVISIHVLREVTNNFSDENVLGRGGFGIVYKGELHDGTKIAVKRMESNAMGTKGMNEFQAEIAVLTKVRHRHLVALLGYCINDNERLLVYEYMPQGTLGQHLFEWKELGFPPLTWKQRVTIALDVARGVEYLHSLAQSSFIHRDLKPNNILLGDDLRAKVADFGLVKNAPDGGKYSMVTRLAGTFGYLAPEYAATGRVTIKVDVYAFGVILMEMITGRKVLDQTMPEESCHLVTWFRRILINKENIRKAIDDILDPDDETYEIILKVAELAGHCTARDPYQRPDMGHSVNILGPLVEQWRPACQEEENGYGIDLDMSLPQTLRRWQANEGTSSSFSDVSFSQTQSSIPAKPSGFPDSFRSTDCR